jgi:hypothetical protein
MPSIVDCRCGKKGREAARTLRQIQEKHEIKIPQLARTTILASRTCATRPFQISALFLRPHGDRPSLKFHCRSDKLVLLETVVDGDVARAARWLLIVLEGAKAWVVATTINRTVAKKLNFAIFKGCV